MRREPCADGPSTTCTRVRARSPRARTPSLLDPWWRCCAICSGRAGRRSRRRKWFLSRLRSRPAPTKRPIAKVPRRPDPRTKPASGARTGRPIGLAAREEGIMPTWLVPTLKWGGIGLAIIALIAIIYVHFIAAPAPPEATAATDEAPMTLYWIMLLVGVVAAIAGFVIGRRPGPT